MCVLSQKLEVREWEKKSTENKASGEWRKEDTQIVG